jgi:hypothetical protein
LSQPLKNNVSRKIIACAFLEGQPEIGQTVERDGTHHHQARNPVHLQFKGKRDQALDFFRSVVWPLGDDFDLRRGEVGIGVYRHPLKRQDSPNRDESGQHQYQELLTERRLHYSVDHSVVVEIGASVIGVQTLRSYLSYGKFRLRPINAIDHDAPSA